MVGKPCVEFKLETRGPLLADKKGASLSDAPFKLRQ